MPHAQPSPAAAVSINQAPPMQWLLIDALIQSLSTVPKSSECVQSTHLPSLINVFCFYKTNRRGRCSYSLTMRTNTRRRPRYDWHNQWHDNTMHFRKIAWVTVSGYKTYRLEYYSAQETGKMFWMKPDSSTWTVYGLSRQRISYQHI